MEMADKSERSEESKVYGGLGVDLIAFWWKWEEGPRKHGQTIIKEDVCPLLQKRNRRVFAERPAAVARSVAGGICLATLINCCRRRLYLARRTRRGDRG